MPGSAPPDNPVGDEFARMADDGRRYVVLHHALSSTRGGVPHREGEILSARDLGPGAEIGRLLRLVAIREASPDEIAGPG